MNDEQFEAIGAFLEANRAALSWNPKVRALAESVGLSITPAGFYYPVPTLQDVESSFEYLEPEPFRNPDLFDAERLGNELRTLIPFGAEFDPPSEGDKQHPGGFFWGMGPFAFSDAFAYYTMIRSRKPRTIIEIGSGASTLIAIEAVRRNGFGRIVCIEPYPPAYLVGRREIELIQRPAQSFGAGFFNDTLADGDLLFIDSTHTVKSGSDCVHLYLRVLPALARSVSVHVHDIFLPEGLPKAWLTEKQIYWAEQYLLMAYLLDNPRARITFGSAVNRTLHRELMEQLNGGKAEIGGGSLWFDLRGKPSA